MKKFLSLLAIVLMATVGAIGQAPGIFNYQGVARNSVGNVLVNKTITLRLTIHDGAAAGPTVYQESRTVTTNPFGLFNVQVGSPGASAVTGTVAGVPWNVGSKFIQVEIDPNGGTSFINIGTAQIASVPYSLYATTAGDLVLPFIKTQAAPGTTLIGLTNSATTGTLGAFTGVSASTDGNAYAITGTISSASPGGFSAGLRGINNGTAGLGIGVYGSQAGGGWGVYGFTPSGRGVFGESTSGIGAFGSSSSGIGVYGTSSTGRAGLFENTNTANTSDALVAITNGAASSWAIRGTSTGLQGAGIFTYNNAAGAANALRVTNNGSGAGISVSATGTGSAGVFNNTNAANNASPVTITTNSTNAPALSVAGPDIWGSAIGITNSTSGMEWRMNVSGTTWGITKIPGTTFTPFQLFSDGQVEFRNTAGVNRMRILDNGDVGIGTTTPFSRLTVVQNNSGVNLGGGAATGSEIKFLNAGTAHMSIYNKGNNALTFAQTSAVSQTNLLGTELMTLTSGGNLGIGINAPTRRLHVVGGVNITDGTQGLNKILTSDAGGNASWNNLAAIGVVSGTGTLNFIPKWTPDGATIGNSQLFDNGTNIGLNTILPNARLDIANATAATRGMQVINSNVTNNSSAVFAQTDNITSASFFEGSAITGVMPLNVATTMLSGASTIKGIASTNAAVSQFSGIGVQGASAAGFGVVGNTNSGIALAGIGWGSGYGLYTFGKVQIEGQGAGLNKILRSDATGNATWETLSSIGGVSGSGTLNFVPKWTPNGTTLGNSQAFDNGVTYSIGSTTPTSDKFYVSNAASNAWATINQAGANVGGVSFTRANAYKFDIAMNSADDFYIQNYTSGSTALTILGANSNVGINQPNPTANLDVNGTFKLTDGSQGAGKVLTSDAAGNASWQLGGGGGLTKFSSAWVGAYDAPSRDTSIDGTLTKVYFVLAPEITPAVIASGQITVYMKVGGIGPYELPYISNAGGRANALQAFFQPGKIGITRPTFNEVAPNNINIPGTLEFRYVIIQ